LRRRQCPRPPKYRKRFTKPGPSKNELKVSRGASEEQQKARAGTLRERFPDVSQLQLDLRMETATGAVLEKNLRVIDRDETLLLDVPCQGACGNGLFLLKDAVETLLQAHQENREGMAICQGVSYMDSKLPCGTKLYYRIQASY